MALLPRLFRFIRKFTLTHYRSSYYAFPLWLNAGADVFRTLFFTPLVLKNRFRPNFGPIRWHQYGPRIETGTSSRSSRDKLLRVFPALGKVSNRHGIGTAIGAQQQWSWIWAHIWWRAVNRPTIMNCNRTRAPTQVGRTRYIHLCQICVSNIAGPEASLIVEVEQWALMTLRYDAHRCHFIANILQVDTKS